MSQIVKYILCFFLLMIAARLSSFAQTALDNPFEVFHGAKPRGKVDSVLIYQYPYEGSQNYLYVYSESGQLIKFDLYRYWINPDFGTKNRDTLKMFYNYNKAGKLVSKTARYGGKPVAYQYLPSAYGYAIRTSTYDSTKIYEMRFNKSGKMIQSGTYSRDGKPYRQYGNYDYQYDSRGHLIGKIEYYNGSIPFSKITYKYNGDGDEVETKQVLPTAQRIYTYKYSNYDKKHNWTLQAVDFARVMDGDTIHNQITYRRRITYYK
ncbi:hypothetical protein ACFS5N_14570 [Mucilaginibacter ximonensis]|uniref:YD repeat-containing protein n=1 Tax=Mucilaginibacter ximonensis TaxID=538021 RepID=A0ABW5YFV2_9SPHI